MSRNSPPGGMVVGSAVALLSFFGGALGVGVLNPVVPFLFAIAANRWLEALLFVAATSLGAIAAALVYGMTRAPFLAPTIADTAAETTPAE